MRPPSSEPRSGYDGHTVSTLGAVGDAYWKSLFGRRTFFENAGTKRGAMLFLMMGTKRSFFFIRLRRASTQRLSSTLPCLIPIPYGSSRNRSSVSFAAGFVAAMRASYVSSNMTASARPWLNARTAFVTLSTTTTSVPVKHLFIHRS